MNRNTKINIDFFWLLPLVICVAGVPGKYLISGDESRVAGIIQEMLIYHNWSIPKLNGAAFLEYPPLFYWLQAIPLAIFKTEWSLAIIPCIVSFCTGIITYLLARKLSFTQNIAKLSVIFLLCGSQFFFNRLECRVDITLAFFCLCSIYSYLAMQQYAGERGKFIWFIITALSISAGIFTKGLLGIVLPISVIGGNLLLSDLLNCKLSIKKYFVILAIFVLSLLPLTVWLYHVYNQLGASGFYTAFIHNNFSRFSGTQGDHSRVIFWYFMKIPEIFLPFIPLLIFDLYFVLKKVFSQKDEKYMFLLSYILFPWLILNVASAKRLVYLLPLAPAAAILAADGSKKLMEIISEKTVKLYQHLIKNTKMYLYIGIACIAVLITVEHIVRITQYQDNNLRECFTAAEKLSQAGHRKIILVNAQERTLGGAVFYLCRKFENRGITPNSKAAPSEIWICRIRKPCGTIFADNHQILESEEQQNVFIQTLKQLKLKTRK